MKVRGSLVFALGFCVLFLSWAAVSVVKADSWDWRNVNVVNWNSPVKSQVGGTCWDFSTCSTYEAKYMLTRNDSTFVPGISAQHMMWDPPWDDYPLYSGMLGFDQLLKYTTNHGLVSGTELPIDYANPENPPTGWALDPGWESRVFKSANYQWAPLKDLKTLIKTTGPIEMGFNASAAFGSVAEMKANYQPLTYNYDNHAVSLIGFKDDATCPNGGYWIIKNSWDTGWGDNGYGYIPYGSTLDLNEHTFSLGPVYYTGPMYHTGPWDGTGTDYTGTAATNTWKGLTSAVWNTSIGTANNWRNNSTSATFQWVNQELQAVFDSTGTNKAIIVSGKVIAHGLTISAADYSYAPANSSSSLTITAGGIVTSESATFSAPVYIGGPQSWNVASGKTLTVSGALHTVVSDLTFSGAGSTVISGAIDGGGLLNSLGAKPGGLIQAGTGAVTISGTANFSGNITANAGTGTLTINAPGGGAAIWDGGYNGGGSISFNGSSLTLGGGASNFTGSMTFTQACSLQFVPASGVTGTFGSAFNNMVTSVTQNGAGTTILNGTNNYTGNTLISNGALQARIGSNIPNGSFLILDGGVLQNNGSSSYTFVRGLGTSGGAFQWGLNGGGFSANNYAMTVSIGSSTSPVALTWGDSSSDIGSKVLGTLKLSSQSAAAKTTFKNALGMGAVFRTIQVDDNPNTTADWAEISGTITGSAGLKKTGDGLLYLSATNNFTGPVTIGGGVLRANVGTGLPTNSYLVIDGGILLNSSTSFTRTLSATQSGSTFAFGPGGGGFAPYSSALTINAGNDGRTLAWGTTAGTNLMGTLKLGLVSTTANITLQNGLDLAGGARTLEINGNANTTYLNGAISDSLGGGSLTKNGYGTLYIQGSTGNTYTGTTTLNWGKTYLNKTSGYAIPGNLVLYSPVDTPGKWVEQNETFVIAYGASQQFSPNSVLSFVNFNGNNWSRFETYGNSVILGGASGVGVIENTDYETGIGNGTITFNNTTDCWFGGYLRNTEGGSGTLSVNKTGPGAQTLSGEGIIYSGSTTVNEGTLIFENVTNASLLARNVSIAGGTLCVRNTDGNLNPNFSGVLSGNGGLLKTGGAAVTLSGSSGNTYTGPTTINEGTLILAKSSGYALSGDITISNAYTYLVVQKPNQFPATSKVKFTGSGDPHFEIYGNTVTVAGISGTVGGAIENTEGETGVGNGTLIVNNTEDCSYSSYIRDAAGGSGTLSIVKNGPAKLTLPSGSSSYTGSTTISGGILEANSGVGLPTASFLSIDGGILQSYGSASFTRGFGTGTGKFQMTANGGGFAAGSGAMSVYLNGGSASVTWGDTVGSNLFGTLKLSSTAAANVVTFYNPIALGSAIRTVQVDDNVNSTADYAVFAGALSGTGGLTKTGNGLLRMAATNTYTGLTTVSNGTLQLGTGSTTGSVAGSIFVDAAGTLAVNRSNAVAFSSILSGSGTLVKNNSNTLTMSGSNAFTGNLIVSAGMLDYSGNSILPGGNYSIASSSTLNIGALSQTISGLKITGGTLSGTGTLSSSSTYDVQAGTVSAVLGGNSGLTKTTSSSATVTNPTYTGTTNVQAGTLTFSGGLPGGNYVISGGTLSFSALLKSIGSLQITGGTLSGTTGVLTSATNYDIQAGSIGAILSGSAGVNKTGSGTATFNKTPTYTGTTSVQAGTLAFTSGLPGGNYAISGGTLDIRALTKTIGTLQITGGTLTSSTGGTLSSSTAFDVQAGTVGAVLAGTAGLNKTGAGTATVSKTPAYTGTTSVQAGTLTFTVGLPSGAYAVSGGTLDIGSLTKNIGNFQITGGTVTGTTGSLSSRNAYDVQAGTVNAILAGSGIGLNKTGTGTAILSAANSYTGATTISAGTLALTSTGQISPTSGVNNNATLVVIDGSHALGTVSGSGSLKVGGSSTLTATSIVQDTLTIGGDYSSLIPPVADASSAQTVPEPASLALLASLAVILTAFYRRSPRR
jgi:autotransporter-associated beta strand protein